MIYLTKIFMMGYFWMEGCRGEGVEHLMTLLEKLTRKVLFVVFVLL